MVIAEAGKKPVGECLEKSIRVEVFAVYTMLRSDEKDAWMY